VEWQLIDISGRIVRAGNNASTVHLSHSELSKGVYALRLRSEKNAGNDKVANSLEQTVYLGINLIDNLSEVFWVFGEVVFVNFNNQKFALVVIANPSFITLV